MDREARQEHKANQKQLALQSAKLEVARFENEIELLLSLHKEAVDPVDWDVQLRALPSALPFRIPFDALKAERRQLFEDPSSDWESVVSARKSSTGGASDQPPELPTRAIQSRQLARDVLKGDEAAYTAAINQFSSLDEVQASGCELDLIYHDPDRFEVVLELGDINAVPSEQKSLRANGKVSVKKMPVKQRAEIYQDYICSCLLRVAREVFAVLPIKKLLLHARVRLSIRTNSCVKSLIKGSREDIDCSGILPVDLVSIFEEISRQVSNKGREKKTQRECATIQFLASYSNRSFRKYRCRSVAR